MSAAREQGAMAEPYAWFWQDGSEGGVVTTRVDYESHRARYPRMTFVPVYTLTDRATPAEPSARPQEPALTEEAATSIAEVQRVAALVRETQPVWSAHLTSVCRAALSSSATEPDRNAALTDGQFWEWLANVGWLPESYEAVGAKRLFDFLAARTQEQT